MTDLGFYGEKAQSHRRFKRFTMAFSVILQQFRDSWVKFQHISGKILAIRTWGIWPYLFLRRKGVIYPDLRRIAGAIAVS